MTRKKELEFTLDEFYSWYTSHNYILDPCEKKHAQKTTLYMEGNKTATVWYLMAGAGHRFGAGLFVRVYI